MHYYWWFFWILLWVVFFSFMTPMRRVAYRAMQSPMQLLQRRYAAGELTSDEMDRFLERSLNPEIIISAPLQVVSCLLVSFPCMVP